MALLAQEEWQKAHELVVKTLEDMPANPLLWRILTILALEKGDRQALKLLLANPSKVPSEPEILTNLGLLLMDQRQAKDALLFFVKAQELLPSVAATNFNLGNVWGELRNYLKAEEYLFKALEINSGFALAWQILGNIYQDQSKLWEAHQAFQKARECDPGSIQTMSSLIMNLQYIPGISLEEIWAWHKKWADNFAYKEKIIIKDRKDGPLTIGYLFAYCRQHPVGSLSLNALLNHDREKFRLIGYANAPGDVCEQKLRQHFHLWRDIKELDDITAARQIEADGVDILVDMAGHTQDNRLRIFSLKPAPLQIHWGVAYWNSTGLSEIDYLISDHKEIPPNTSQQFSEKILYMPDSFICYSPPDITPEISLSPKGAFTFGSFNRAAKFNDPLFAAWGKIFAALPEARLCLQCRSFDNATMQENIWQRLEKVGIARDRVDLIGFLPHREIFALYSRLHLVLDPFPWAGSIIACEGMWMGVPPVTLRGQDIAGKHAASYLETLGLPEFIAENIAEYIEKAIYWAENPDKLKDLRANLRKKMLDSPLCDGLNFAKTLENTYQRIWQDYVRQKCA